MIEGLFQNQPVVAAIVLIVFGLVLASVLAWFAGRTLRWINRRARRISSSVTVSNDWTEKLVQRTVYFLTLIITALLAFRLLGWSTLLDPAIASLPGILAGSLIMFVGYLFSAFIFQVIAGSEWVGENLLMPRLLQALILSLALLTGLAAMSIDVSFLGQSLVMLLVVTLGGLSLSFALGSGRYVENLLARRSFRDFARGDRIKMGELEGVLLDFTATSVLVQTDEGVAVVPARVFADAVVVRLTSA